MTIGEKNRLVEFWKPSEELDQENRPVDWTFVKSKYAEISGETGMAVIRRQASEGNINTDLARYSMRINFDRSIDTTMQVREHGTIYDVVAVRHDMAGRINTYVICHLGAANG